MVLKHYDFPKWLFKGSHVVQKKNGNLFFSKKKKKKKREISFQKKKKIILFKKSSFLELRLDLILYERGMLAAFQKPSPNHPNNLGEEIQNNVTKLFGCMLG